MERLTPRNWKEIYKGSEELLHPRFIKLAEYEDAGLEAYQIELREYDIKLLSRENKEYREEILKLREQLSKYIDTKLTPEEINRLGCELVSMIEINKNNVALAINQLSEQNKQLNEYQQAEEQGLLIKLPCKVGNSVYEPNTSRNIISEYEITEIIINKYGVSFFRWQLKEGIYSSLTGFPVECLGKTVFLTREAAEQVLEDRIMGEDNKKIISSTDNPDIFSLLTKDLIEAMREAGEKALKGDKAI